MPALDHNAEITNTIITTSECDSVPSAYLLGQQVEVHEDGGHIYPVERAAHKVNIDDELRDTV